MESHDEYDCKIGLVMKKDEYEGTPLHDREENKLKYKNKF